MSAEMIANKPVAEEVIIHKFHNIEINFTKEMLADPTTMTKQDLCDMLMAASMREV